MLIENNRDKNSLRLKSVESFNQQRLKSKSLVDWNTMWLKSVEILGQCRWCPTPLTYLDHFDTFGENFDFDTFKNDTFESVWVDRQSHS